ncbi:HU family DNA-binding protein [Paraburkholderia strydomiana]|uniref:hypothetical protein n=1 Tax=Paraburkholderia strydomiana TaxID=1245417 RepID=UPI0038B6DE0E
MNKQDLIDAVAAQTGSSKAADADTLDALIGAITAGFCRSKPICYGGRSRDERCKE